MPVKPFTSWTPILQSIITTISTACSAITVPSFGGFRSSLVRFFNQFFYRIGSAVGARSFVRGSRVLRSAYVAPGSAGQPDLELTILELRRREQTSLRGILHEARELRHAEILLVERAVDILHDLLEAIGAHHVSGALHTVDRLGDQLPRIPLLRRLFLLGVLHEAGERVVAVVLVAVHDEEVARRLANADADDVLAVLLELEHERREVAVARQQDVGADFGTREDELHRVDGEADVGGVLLRRAVRRGEDQIDRRFGERHDVLRVAPPVGVCPYHDRAA
jgi:hypothetical protein